eukprot:g3961.t1
MWLPWSREFPLAATETACYADLDTSFAHSGNTLKLDIKRSGGSGSWAFGRLFVTSDAALHVDENSAAGTPVGPAVQAYDQDVSHNLVYGVVDGPDSTLFTMDKVTGQLRVREGAALDYENRAQIRVSLRAADSSVDALKDEAQVVVFVDDVNDVPVWSSTQRLEVDEGTTEQDVTVGTLVGQLEARDDDVEAGLTGDTLTYAFGLDSTGNESSLRGSVFVVHGNGSVTTGPSGSSLLDFETQSRHNLTFAVRDAKGSGWINKVLPVNVRDVNERPLWCCSGVTMPCRAAGYRINDATGVPDICRSSTSEPMRDSEVEENVPVGTIVGQMWNQKGRQVNMLDYVYDGDRGQQHTITIVGGDKACERPEEGGCTFAINNTVDGGDGQLYVRNVGPKLKDYPSGELQLTLKVTDNGVHPDQRDALSQTTKLTLKIQNTNDPPRFACARRDYCDEQFGCEPEAQEDGTIQYTRLKFDASQFPKDCTLEVDENSPLGTFVGEISAYDPESEPMTTKDDPEPQTITYILNSNGEGPFTITQNEIRRKGVNNDLDQRSYSKLSINDDSLDFERQRYYVIEVEARDDGIIRDRDGNEEEQEQRSGYGVFLIKVRNKVDLPLLHDLVMLVQNGLATSGNEFVSLFGDDLGQLKANSLTETALITARYGQGMRTVHEVQRVEVPASSASFRFSLDGSAVGAKVVGYTSTLEDVHAAIEELEAVSSVINVTHATPRAAGHIAWDITFGQTRRASQHNAASTDAAAIVDDGDYGYGMDLDKLQVHRQSETVAEPTGVSIVEVEKGQAGYFFGDKCNSTADALCETLTDLDLTVFETTQCDVITQFKQVNCLTVTGFGKDLLWELSVNGKKSNIGPDGQATQPTANYAPPTLIAFSDKGASNADTAGGQAVVITGTQFGTRAANAVTRVTYSGGVSDTTFVANNCTIIKDHTEMRCRMSEGTGATLKWVVTVAGQSSETPTTSYQAPSVTTITGPGANGASTEGSQSVTISGSNFGPIAVRPTVRYRTKDQDNLAIRAEYEAVNCSISVPHEKIVCVTAPGEGKDLEWEVRVEDLASEWSSQLTSYGRPSLKKTSNEATKESPASGATTGLTIVNIDGDNFGTNIARVFFDDVRIDTVTYVSDQQIKFATRPGIGTRHTIRLQVRGQFSDVVYYNFLRPLIREFKNIPSKDTAQSNLNIIRVDGANFGHSGAQPHEQISFHEKQTPVASVWLFKRLAHAQAFADTSPLSQNAILDPPPMAAAADRSECNIIRCENDKHARECDPGGMVVCTSAENEAFVVVRVADQLSVPRKFSRESLVAAQRPTITEINPKSGATNGNYTVTLTGDYFGDINDVEIGVFDGRGHFERADIVNRTSQDFLALEDATTVAQDEIVFTMPPGQGNLQVRVFAGRIVRTQSIAFTYDAPSIISLSPRTGATCGHDACAEMDNMNATVVTVTGENFGIDEATKGWGGAGVVKIAGRACVPLSRSHTQITCKLPAGVGSNLPVIYDFNPYGADYSNTESAQTFSYLAPAIAAVQPATMPTAGGTNRERTINVTGTNFGSPTFGQQVTLTWRHGDAQEQAIVLATHSHDMISFVVPAGVGANNRFTVSVAGQLTQRHFSYDRPVVTKVSPNPFNADQDTLTIEGRNFGQSGASQTTVRVSGIECVPKPGSAGVHVSNFRLECDVVDLTAKPVRTHAVGHKFVQVEVDGQPSDEFWGSDDPSAACGHDKENNANLVELLKLVDVEDDYCQGTDAADCEATELLVAESGTTKTTYKKPQYLHLKDRGEQNSICLGRPDGGQTASMGTLEAVCRPGKYNTGQDRASTGSLWVGGFCGDCPSSAECYGGLAKPHAAAKFWRTTAEEVTMPDICISPYNMTGFTKTARDELKTRLAADFASQGLTIDVMSSKQVESDTEFVQCQPPEGCGNQNECRPGYGGQRCATCLRQGQCLGGKEECASDKKMEITYYRDFIEGTCEPCPDNAMTLLIVYFVSLLAICYIGYQLHRRGPNMAALAIGIDYYQVLSMFSNLKFQWPSYVATTLEYSTLALGSLEITSPECSVQFTYQQKWYGVQLFPLALFGVFFFAHCLIYIKKKLTRSEGRNMMKHVPIMVSFYFQAMYYLFIYVTKTTLEVFRCEDKGGGNLFLEVDPSIPCEGAEYDDMTGIAFGSLLLYSFGIPILLACVLYKHRWAIFEDQKLWMQGKGASKELNPHYYVRKKYGKLYQYFKSQYFYWVVVILCRKLCISLIIAGIKSPLFAASLGVLLLFISMMAHMNTKPYLAPSTYSFGELTRAEGD